MKFRSNILIASLLALIITAASQVQGEFQVKVLLEQAPANEKIKWEFSSPEPFKLLFPEPGKTPKTYTKLAISTKHQKIYLNGELCKSPAVKLVPSSTPIKLNGQAFHGKFLIKFNKNVALLVNQVEIEDYICSVLKTECWPGWPKEINKAMAISARSYVVAQVLESRKTKRPFHIKNSSYHQTYTGINESQPVIEAVAETKGLVLSHQGKPILAMFDSCCGGVIPALMEGKDFKNYPYLARTERCDFCKPFKVYNWNATYNRHDFHQKIVKAHPKIKNIKKISVKTDPAGIVKRWTFHSSNGVYHLDSRIIYGLFKDIKSYCFSIQHKSNLIKVDGTGLGHHLGLCQWGARQMVTEGYDYPTILKFYYPGTKLMKLKE